MTGEDKEDIPKLAKRRLNMPNPLDAIEVTFDFDLNKFPPKGGNARWKSFKLKDLRNPDYRNGSILGYVIPHLAFMNTRALYNFVLGNFR